MIDLKDHIVSIIAIFLALGLGILIGSSIVSDDLMVTQQQRIIDRLEQQFATLREQENNLLAENEAKNKIINNYENFGQVMLGPIVKEHLKGAELAIVVTGGEEIPAGLLNTLTIAGATVNTQTVMLNNINLKDSSLRRKLVKFYGTEEDVSSDALRQKVAISVGMLITNQADIGTRKFLEENNLIKLGGVYTNPVDTVILIGGSNNSGNSYPESFDTNLINILLASGKQIVGVENSKVSYSYMETYQKYNLTTIDNIDLSLGQISLVLAMTGQPGDYGTKTTATKFMPSIPVEYLRR
ncbi:Protein of unknown function DUF3186 [Syntrophomonas zehnderi OL-4]|uniref:Copper transporter n=1 Tax=Syntrophomonas zehnderi OL-4 TaxID=690567 RepID=A0A0E3W352_9FIRM|nr:copper transporter [Syntrophomonas zehnderi]CFX50468.1 Protein of unknown function DUF3186 [Syntrophomonas zehnderi OL-4]